MFTPKSLCQLLYKAFCKQLPKPLRLKPFDPSAFQSCITVLSIRIPYQLWGVAANICRGPKVEQDNKAPFSLWARPYPSMLYGTTLEVPYDCAIRMRRDEGWRLVHKTTVVLYKLCSVTLCMLCICSCMHTNVYTLSLLIWSFCMCSLASRVLFQYKGLYVLQLSQDLKCIFKE